MGDADETGETGDARYNTGMRVRREVLGDDYVDRMSRDAGLGADFQRFVAETAWGSVWARPGLERRTRSLITIAILAALGRHEELALHLSATRRTGASPEEVTEALLHVAVYAGVPAANSAFALAKATLANASPAGAAAPDGAAAPHGRDDERESDT